MVEVIPRPHKPNLLVQVSVAVISGAAAMYCIQSFRPAGNSPTPAVRKNPPTTDTNGPQSPHPAEPGAPSVAAALDPGAEPPRLKAAPPAAVSMLIMPEPGGAAGGVVSVGESGPAPDGTAPSPVKKQEPAAVPARQKTPAVHLQHRNLHSQYTGRVGHDFQSSQLSPRLFPEKAALRAEPAPPEAPSKPAPHFIAYPRNFGGKGIAQKDVFVPSTLHPEVVPEKPFWDDKRTRQAVVAGLVALSGALYLIFGLGFFNALVAKPRFEDEPGP